jgi:2-polyprenyl-6-methoxyphenol hydroxylase-like FAD-dependent oxidoreductase
VADAERTTCLVIGGRPAGMMLALLLARAGVEVTVLEKHGTSFGIFAATRCIRRPCGFSTS